MMIIINYYIVYHFTVWYDLLLLCFRLSCSLLIVVSGILSISNLEDNSLGIFVNPVCTCPEPDWNPSVKVDCNRSPYSCLSRAWWGSPPFCENTFPSETASRMSRMKNGDFALANIPSGCKSCWWNISRKKLPQDNPRQPVFSGLSSNTEDLLPNIQYATSDPSFFERKHMYHETLTCFFLGM